MEEERQRAYSTRDIYMASSFSTLGFPVVSVDYQLEGVRPNPVGYFNFDDTPELRKAEADYLRGALSVEPKALFTAFKALKGLVTSRYKGPSSAFVDGRK